jgi:hypothetical protein
MLICTRGRSEVVREPLAVYRRSMFPEHPPLPGLAHPWHDPLAPADPYVQRPDWALHQIGPLPQPRPEDFPYTEEGRRDYYLALELAARQNMVISSSTRRCNIRQRLRRDERRLRVRRRLRRRLSGRDWNRTCFSSCDPHTLGVPVGDLCAVRRVGAAPA